MVNYGENDVVKRYYVSMCVSLVLSIISSG